MKGGFCWRPLSLPEQIPNQRPRLELRGSDFRSCSPLQPGPGEDSPQSDPDDARRHGRRAWHRVIAEAGNVQDARALAETIFFDIAILDINFAGSSIAPVATIIARRGLPFFFVSGYGLAGRPEAFIERPALQKPVSISIFGETINAILATAGKASSRADDSSPNIQ